MSITMIIITTIIIICQNLFTRVSNLLHRIQTIEKKQLL